MWYYLFLKKDIIDEALKHVSRKSSEYHIEVQMEDEMQLVKVDSRLVLQVIINIVDNAMKYTPSGGTICISTKREGANVHICIADNGIGISDDKKPYIFDMFYTANETIADSKRNLGLGLALCKSIISAYGGIIEVLDNKPKGTVFDFTLPVEEYHVAKDGKQAIIEATTQNPEMILPDLGLPDMDGVDVIKKNRNWSTVPITVISARSEDKDKIDALDAGADDYLTKPFSTEELLARIRGIYRRIRYIENNISSEQPYFQNGSLKIDYGMQTVYVKDVEIHVTPIEYKILCLLAKNIGRVLTHIYITKEIWGSSLEGDVASLRVHVATVRKK